MLEMVPRVFQVLVRRIARSGLVGCGAALALAAAPIPAVAAAAVEPPGEGPPDLTPYQRPLIPGEGREALPKRAGFSLIDLVVAAGLGETDTFNDSETSIAVDPNDASHLAISAFSGFWGATSPLWTSSDGGLTWAKSASIPAPTGSPPEAEECPCDQTFDFGRSSPLLFGSFLGLGQNDNLVWTGSSADPAAEAAWQWPTGGAGGAQVTSHAMYPDQPWLLVGRDPRTASQDVVYVGYTDYYTVPPSNRVAFSQGEDPPDFTAAQDAVVGTSSGTGYLAAAALRLAVDPQSGAVWAAWQDEVSLDPVNCAKHVVFRLSRSSGRGQPWSLNGHPEGIVVASVETDEGRPENPNQPQGPCHDHVAKFGTVNALLGGSEALAVDPTHGDLYYVYRVRDGKTGNNRLAAAHLVSGRRGVVKIAGTSFVTGQVQAALPAVAVAANGTVGVLYVTYDGMVSGFPRFTVHLAQSTNRGGSWVTQTILTFLSPATDNGNTRQRVLGDYLQLKAAGNTFYGAFAANGAEAGRKISNIDPFFLKAAAASPGGRHPGLPADAAGMEPGDGSFGDEPP